MKYTQKKNEIILASKSEVRKKILEENKISCKAIPSNLDEEPIKASLVKDGASPEIVSKNLAELKAIKVSMLYKDCITIGADSVIDFENKIISKPKSREEAYNILEKLNGKVHYLISSVSIATNGKMIWNYTEKAKLTMIKFNQKQIMDYLSKISDQNLYAYNVYQIEGEGRNLFSSIEGDENTIMGLPIFKIKEYLKNL